MALANYEPDFVAVLRRVLRSGDIYVDAGAQLGYFAAEAARHIGPTGQMFLFEPDPRAYARLAAHLATGRPSRIPRTKLFCEALSDHLGQGHINMLNVMGWSQVARASESQPPVNRCRAAPTAEIRLTTLDTVLEAEQVEQVRLLKIDVEGHEVFVLRGARHTLGTIRPDYILVEFNEQALAQHGFLGRHIHAMIAHHGYRGAVLSGARIGRNTCESEPLANFLYARTEALLRGALPDLPPAVPEEEFTAEEIEAAWLEANDDDAPDVWARRIVSMAAAGQLATAIAEGERLLDKFPDLWWFRGHLAHWLRCTGAVGRARAHYERMLAEQPDSAEVARILRDLGAN